VVAVVRWRRLERKRKKKKIPIGLQVLQGRHPPFSAAILNTILQNYYLCYAVDRLQF
jgi:hypothetical protein